MTVRVIIGTPCRTAEVGKKYHTTILRMMRYEGVESGAELGWLMYDGDIVRVRSRIARQAIERKADYLFFVDSDVSFDERLLPALLACDVDFVGAPYARKRIYWERLNTAHVHCEQDMYDWPIKEGDAKQVAPNLIQVAGLPMGCTLIKVSALERMTAHYGTSDALGAQAARVSAELRHNEGCPELYDDGACECFVARTRAVLAQVGRQSLTFTDEALDGQPGKATVALFQLLIVNGGLLSEDHSFSHRASALSIHPHLYLGPHAPADHTGAYCWHGSTKA